MADSKSYQLTITQKPGYVHAVITGSNTRENMVAYLEELLRECEAKHYRRVLIEERLVGPRISTTDMYQLAAEMTERARGIVEAVALIDVNAEDERNVKFAEDVAVNRGLRAKRFRSVEEATKWLEV